MKEDYSKRQSKKIPLCIYHNGTDDKSSTVFCLIDLLRGLIIVYNKLEPTISIQEYLDCVDAKVE